MLKVGLMNQAPTMNQAHALNIVDLINQIHTDEIFSWILFVIDFLRVSFGWVAEEVTCSFLDYF